MTDDTATVVMVGTVKDLALAMDTEPQSFLDGIYGRWGQSFLGDVWGIAAHDDEPTDGTEPKYKKGDFIVIEKVADVETPIEPLFVATMLKQWEYTGKNHPKGDGDVVTETGTIVLPREGGLAQILNGNKPTPGTDLVPTNPRGIKLLKTDKEK